MKAHAKVRNASDTPDAVQLCSPAEAIQWSAKCSESWRRDCKHHLTLQLTCSLRTFHSFCMRAPKASASSPPRPSGLSGLISAL